MKKYTILVSIKATVGGRTYEQAGGLAKALVEQELEDLNLEDHHFTVDTVSVEPRQLELDL